MAAAFPLPSNLVASVTRDRTPHRAEWFSQLPGIVRELAERWSLRLGEPYQPGGDTAWVAPVRDALGRDLVLKVGWRHYEADHEAAGLAVWSGHGTVLLYDNEVFDSTSALLIERCVPGTTLGELLPEPEQDVVIAGLLRRLWTVPPDDHPFRPLEQMCAAWADAFEERYDETVLDPGVARAGMELFRGLPATTGRRVLLCTDLHAGNVLAAGREPWLVVDPKPYVGDPAYDVLQHFLNCTERLTADPVALVKRMAGLLDLDPERVRQWAFARCVQESIDEPALREVATRLAHAGA